MPPLLASRVTIAARPAVELLLAAWAVHLENSSSLVHVLYVPRTALSAPMLLLAPLVGRVSW